ncbi:MAG: hypothetical protein AB1642_13480 [Pseudomonadota bacterium]
MNPVPWARLVAVAVVLLAGIALGGWLAARHFEPRLAEANRKLGEYQHAYLTLAEATGRQNAAIEAMKTAEHERQARAVRAAATARREARGHYNAAQAILGLKPSAGTDACAAARADFDAELRAERGLP